MNDTPTNTAVLEFIEQMGLAMEADGLPRIAGRMVGYLIVYGGPISFGELADILQVSRGSISTNARLLSTLGVIERVSFPGDRQNYYRLAKDPGEKIIKAGVARIKRVENIMTTATKTVPDSIQGSAERLQQMAHFYSVVGRQMGTLLQELEQG